MATITGLTAARMLAIEAASVVDGDIVGDDLILTKHDASTINAGNVRGSRANRNRIINGDFAVNQRGFSSWTGPTGAYGHDRWMMITAPDGSVVYSTQTAALGDLPEAARAFARMVTSGQAAAGAITYLSQRIESVRSLSGKTATISFWAKAAAGTPKIAVEIYQWFGTGGSPSGQVNTYVGQVTLSTSWTRYSLTVTVPSISGKTLGTAGDDFLSVNLWTSAGSNSNSRTGSLGIQSATIDFWGVQVEEGSTLSPFEQEDYATNLRRCQRYYWQSQANGNDVISHGYITSTTAAGFDVSHPVPMRLNQTVSWASPSFFNETTQTVPAITLLSGPGFISARSCRIGGTGTGFTPGHSITLYLGVGANYVAISAEL